MTRTRTQPPMTRLLLGYGLGARSLAAVLGCSRPTAQSRLDDPGRLTLDELARICERGVPAEEIRGAITFGR